MAARRGNTALAGDAESWEVDRLGAGETRPFVILALPRLSAADRGIEKRFLSAEGWST